MFISTIIVITVLGLLMTLIMVKAVIVARTRKKFCEITGRNTIIINHRKHPLAFQSQVIDEKTLVFVSKALEKLNGQDVNIVIQSPGGHVFHSQIISRVLQMYDGNIHVYVPRYAASGASLLTLSGDMIHMNKYSCVSPVDVQVGSMISQGSSAAWSEVVEKKGTKASDNAYIFNRLGKQATKTMRDCVKNIIKGKTKKVDETVELFVNGEKEHIFQIYRKDLRDLGFNNIVNITPMEQRLLLEMV